MGTTQANLLKNWEIISENFQVLEWWHREGKNLHPLIYPVACLILALPDSNALQERSFSTATWIDGVLQKRQNDSTFNAKVMLKKNSKFLDEHMEDRRLLRKKETAERTKKLLERRPAEADRDEMLDDYDSSE